ncbi:42843_t:CDS:2, partial [Gigaspora margarita]
VTNPQPNYSPNPVPFSMPLTSIQAFLNSSNSSVLTPMNNNLENQPQEVLQDLLALATNLNSNFPINIPCTLLDMPLLPLTTNKNTYPLIDLSIPDSNNFSSYLTDSSNLLLSTLLDRNCPNISTPLILLRIKVERNEFASDANSTIDEINRQLKNNKEKNKPLNIRCYADKAAARSLSAWKVGAQATFLHQIDTGMALPINQYPYWHSLAKKDIIKKELIYMLTEKIIYLWKFWELMNPSKIPAGLKKTLALLSNQIKKANLTSTYVISANKIIYQEGLQSYKIEIDATKQK